MNDLRFALRQLLKNPGFAAVSIVTLALGIGAATAIFSVANAIMLRPLPYTEPDRLVRIYSEFPGFANGGLRRFSVSGPEYLDLKREAKSWEFLDAWATGDINVGGSAQPVRVAGSAISGDLFRSLGINPALGRTLTPEDDAPGGPQVAVISHGLWQRAFGSEPGILGREVMIDGGKFSIVGVMPRSFEFPPGEIKATELWAPLQIDPANPGGRSDHGLKLLGRLRAGVTVDQAQAEFKTLEKRWGELGSGHQFDGTNHTIVSFGLHDEVVRGVRPAMRMLLGAVAFLLLIACVNVANLLLARAESRRREIAIRGALGAGLRRLGVQFVIEGIVLASVGVCAGLLLAYGGLEALKSTSLANIPRAAEIDIDKRVLFFALGLALTTGIAFGLTPLAHVIRRNLQNALKSAASSTTGAVSVQRFRQALIVGQLALSLTLLIGAGLMLRAFWNLQQVKPGFNPKNLVAMSISLPSSYRAQDIPGFWARLKSRLDGIPGVESAALASGLPPAYSATHSDTVIEGYVPTREGPVQNVEFYQSVSPGYFETMGIRLLQGRFFDSRDSADASEVVVINETMARTFWKSDNPLGRRIRPSGTTNFCTIVGVIADTKNAGLENAARAELCLPYTQNAGRSRSRTMSIIIRTPGDSTAVVNAVRRDLSAMDAALPLANVHTMDALLAAAQSRPRELARLLSTFAIVALILAAVGIYGVISYSVAQRTREFGLRMALGAQRCDVLAIVLTRGMALAFLGIGIGLTGAFALTQFLSTMLFGITPTDPATFIIVSLLFTGVAFLAIALPARHATQIHPMEALRHE